MVKCNADGPIYQARLCQITDLVRNFNLLRALFVQIRRRFLGAPGCPETNLGLPAKIVVFRSFPAHNKAFAGRPWTGRAAARRPAPTRRFAVALVDYNFGAPIGSIAGRRVAYIWFFGSNFRRPG